MALIACHECGYEVSTEAKACPQCGAAPRKPAKTKIWPWILLGLVVIFLGFGAAGNSPEDKARYAEKSAIDTCWDDQKRKSHDASMARFVASACEKMEDDYRTKHGRNP